MKPAPAMNWRTIKTTIDDPIFRRYFIENLVLIADKNRVERKFKFNKVQQRYHSQMTNRDIILKAAQLGFTSLIMAIFLTDCLFKPNTTSVVIAHEEFITQRLLAKAKGFEAGIPETMKVPMTHRSAYELYWEELNSVFYIGSARSFVFGRGERIDNALCSEIAFWSDPEKIMIPLGERVPIQGRLILETTANGEDNYFHQKWQGAAEGQKSGSSIFTPHFFPWWLGEDYRLTADSPEALPRDRTSLLELTEDEERLMKRQGLSQEQIRWRRRKQSELLNYFLQEYPEDPVTCFLPVQEAVFDWELLNNLFGNCLPPIASFNGADIWFPPEPGNIYVIGADPTVGQHDKAAATVWNLNGLVHCATLTGLFEPYIFGEKLKELGHYYNNACLVVEANNSGIAVLESLLQGYSNLYYQRDLPTGRATNRPGWLTTRQTKPYVVQKFKQLLPQMKTHDINLLREARNLRYDGIIIESIGEDDILMSAMIALACSETLPTARHGFVGQAGWNW